MRSDESVDRPAEGKTPVGPRKIAMIAACPFPYPRGTPVRIGRMSGALAARGHEVHVFTYHVGKGGAPPGVTVHRTPRVPTYERTAPGPSYQKLLLMDPLLALLVRRGLRRGGFDLIHAHHAEGLLTALAARPRGLPVVFDIHTLIGSELPFYRLGLPSRLSAWLGRQLDSILPPRADHVVAVTRHIKEALAEGGFPEDDVTVIENGIEWSSFVPAADVPDLEAPMVVFAGNLAPYQGVEYLFQAVSLLRDSHPKLRLRLLVEDTSGLHRYRRLIRKLGIADALTVRETPFRELPAELASGAVAVNPRTECDGMPLKLLNYMAAGLPIVSFAGSAEGLEHDRTGVVAPDGDVAALATRIEELLRDPDKARRLGTAARAEAEKRSWEYQAARLERLYDAMILDR